MAEDLLSVLTRFHREVVLPDLERVVDARLAPLRDEMLSNFDAVFKRLDRLESEYASDRDARAGSPSACRQAAGAPA
jgi:hypothetical protein